MSTTESHVDRPAPQGLLTPQEVARILRVTPRTVRRWGARGTLKRRLGNRLTRYTEASVFRLIDTHHDARPADTGRDATSSADGNGGHAGAG